MQFDHASRTVWICGGVNSHVTSTRRGEGEDYKKPKNFPSDGVGGQVTVWNTPTLNRR